MSSNNDLFCVLHAPYVAGEASRWSIISYHPSASIAVRYLKSKNVELSHGDLLAIVHIDNITQFHLKSIWLGIAKKDGSVIYAPTVSQQIFGQYWFHIYEVEPYAIHMLIASKCIGTRRLIGVMLSCYRAMFPYRKTRLNDLDYLALEKLDEFSDGKEIDKNKFKIIASGIMATERSGPISPMMTLIYRQNCEIDEELRRFALSCAMFDDAREMEMCEIIKELVPMPVAMLACVGETL